MSRKMANLSARLPCEPETRDRIRSMKTDNERYEDVLRRLMDHYEEND